MSYSWKKGAVKLLEIFAYAGIGGLLSYFSKQPQTPTIILTIAALKWLANLIKHWKSE